MDIIVYTDGGCSGNPGPGGWAYVLVAGEARSERSGAEPSTTNNRMELTAVIMALEDLGERPEGEAAHVELHTDSRYVQLGITEWIAKWVRNDWKTASGEPVKNRELWQRLAACAARLDVSWRWVKGHDGIELNERCDALVRGAIARLG